MQNINHEYYVSLEVAKLLKEAGFDWEIMSFYTNDITEGCESEYELRLVKFDNWNGKNKSWCDLVSCPTLDVAQRWLREVKDIDLYIFPTTNNKRVCVYEWGIKTFGRALLVEGQPYTNQYETYEEAQEAGIKKTLEIILEKGK